LLPPMVAAVAVSNPRAPAYHDELAANFEDGLAVVLAEIGDGFEIGSEAARSHIAAGTLSSGRMRLQR
jgi:hypothetical protein